MKGPTAAKIATVLVYYEETQLLLLATDRFPMLAVAIKRDEMEQPFFACEVREKTLRRYMDEKADLHFAFSQAVSERYYFFDLSAAKDGFVRLKKAPKEDAELDQYWPAHGFFARNHTSSEAHVPDSSLAKRTFKIDGKWAATDFSKFHGKMSDLYALYSAMERFDSDAQGVELAEITSLIQSRFWQGGGSYGGFYDDLEARVASVAQRPLEVAAIRYSSPGEIVFKGDAGVLAEIADVVAIFVERADKLEETYRQIRGILRKEKLLSAPPKAPFSSKAMRRFVQKTTDSFADMMEIDSIEQLYAACGRRTLVYAKVVMSIYRRARDLYTFYNEGRVQPE